MAENTPAVNTMKHEEAKSRRTALTLQGKTGVTEMMLCCFLSTLGAAAEANGLHTGLLRAASSQGIPE